MDDLLSLFGQPAQETGVEPEPAAQRNSGPPTTSAELPTNTEIRPPKNLPEAPDCAVPSGEHFIVWLRQGIQSRRLIINDAKALVHTVADTVYLVSPGLFQRYAQEHPSISALAKQDKVQDWQWIQKRFEKLGLHRKQPSGLNIWTCEVMGPRKSRRLHGYLLEDPSHIFDTVPPNNPYLSLK